MKRSSTLTLALAATLLALSAHADAPAPVLDKLASRVSYDEFVVKYRDSGAMAKSNADALRKVSATVSALGANNLALSSMKNLGADARLVRFSRKLDRASTESLLRQWSADPDVEFVEPNYRFYSEGPGKATAVRAAAPTASASNAKAAVSDPRYAEQWNLHGTWGARADQAWGKSTGSGVVVAVLDTGIVPHSDLNANVLPGYDFVSDPVDGSDGDGRDSNPGDEGNWGDFSCRRGERAVSSWTGTYRAGIVAAAANNGVGIAGTAYNAKLLPLRVSGRCGEATNADLADAILWAAGAPVPQVPGNRNPAEVILIPLGDGYYDAGRPGRCPALLQSAIDRAVQRGSTVVVSAGYNRSADELIPANCQRVIVVAGSNEGGGGTTVSGLEKMQIDLSAPAPTLSTSNDGQTLPGNESYGRGNSGASGDAAATVAGVVALMQSASPRTPDNVEQILKATARRPSSSNNYYKGAGIVDANAAVNAAITSNYPPLAQFSLRFDHPTARFTDASSDSDGRIVSYRWSFGDGSSSSERNPTHTYTVGASAGLRYGVTLTVTDNAGATHSKTQYVTVFGEDSLAANFAYEYAPFQRLRATFTSTSRSRPSPNQIVKYEWDFGDGSVATGATAVHQYAIGGIYPVTLKVTEASGATQSRTHQVAATNTEVHTRYDLAVSDLAALKGDGPGESNWLYFLVSGKGSRLTVQTQNGGAGNGVDLYVGNSQPTPTRYVCKSTSAGNQELCEIDLPNPASNADRFYVIGLRPVSNFSRVYLTAAYSRP